MDESDRKTVPYRPKMKNIRKGTREEPEKA